MEFHGLHGQIYLMQNLNQDYEDCSAFRKQLTIFGRLGYNVNLIFNRIKAGQTTSIRTNRTSRLKGFYGLLFQNIQSQISDKVSYQSLLDS